MREHKYRAWHKIEKRMYHVAVLYPDASTVMLQIGDTLFSALFAEIELLEYTGLKDKNGVEIFEGDIIRRYGSWASGRLEEVRYENGHWNYSYDLVEYVEQPDAQWEVIGNLYEHPSLISSEGLPE